MRPLVISHAACAGHAPENTLHGVRRAIELGSDAIEIDVQVSGDGVPVLMHDLTVDRTTTGTGEVAKLSLDELRELNAGGEPIPTLSEVLDLTRSKVLLVMEVKQPGIEEQIARVVADADAAEDVMVWSFFPKAIAGTRAADPRIPTALLVAPEYIPRWPEVRQNALNLGAQGVSVFHLGISAAIAESCRRSGLALYSWTADDESEIRHLVDMDVDGICSNYPDRVVGVLHEQS